MKIELVGALDYDKLKNELEGKVDNVNEVINNIKNLENERRAELVSSAGRLSRFPGDVFEVLNLSEEKSYEQNVKFIKRVTGMGHDSITDHDYLVFAIKNVSPVVEQSIIAERFASFTIKSRREVDFSKVGYYIPDFHDKDNNIIVNNESVKEEYMSYMDSLFNKYSELVDMNIPIEDARFVLPYSYHSNILMGIDAHILKDIIVKYTKTKYANISELKEFGNKLLEIVKENVPYLVEEIDKVEIRDYDEVDNYLESKLDNQKYAVLDKPKLLTSTPNIDDTINLAAIMRRYQYDYELASNIYKETLKDNAEFGKELMQRIVFDSDKLELTQVNFRFQIPISYAVLTHLTRHRTHHILVPDFVPTIDLTQYKVPPKIKNKCLSEYDKVFKDNYEMYCHFKNDYGIREEDLVYFTLSGNIINVITNMDGKTLEHILRLRECTKAQWETRDMAINMHKEIDKLEDAKIFTKLLGPTCMTQGFCKEGKESCGRILKLKK